MNIEGVTKALVRFGEALPEKPVWMLLTRRNGEVITQVGKCEYLFDAEAIVENRTVAAWIQRHCENEIDMLDHLRDGNLQYTISIGTDGVFVILHLHGGYLLGISYHHIGVTSLDALAQGIVVHFTDIVDALYAS